jgi:histidine triad (HIT) family protein
MGRARARRRPPGLPHSLTTQPIQQPLASYCRNVKKGAPICKKTVNSAHVPAMMNAFGHRLSASAREERDRCGQSWRQQRERLNRKVNELRRQGICDTCHDLQAGEPYGSRHVVYEDDHFRVKLEQYPRARGHTIVLYKPHRNDISGLSDEEACRVFQVCVRVVKAIKEALGAEKVYLNTMCDGAINHLHLQRLPRYAGDPIGSTRFVAQRQPITDGDETARLLRSALRSLMNGGKPV